MDSSGFVSESGKFSEAGYSDMDNSGGGSGGGIANGANGHGYGTSGSEKNGPVGGGGSGEKPRSTLNSRPPSATNTTPASRS